MSVVDHQLDVFLFEPESDRYLGRLCSFNQCPKGKYDCLVPGCGDTPFNKRVAGFVPGADLLVPAEQGMLYTRDVGRLRSALDLPQPPVPDPAGRVPPGSVGARTPGSRRQSRSTSGPDASRTIRRT